MKAPKVKSTTTPVSASQLVDVPKVTVSDYFVPPGYSSHVTAHRRMDYIKCSDHSYTKKAEVLALIKWLEAQMPTLAE